MRIQFIILSLILILAGCEKKQSSVDMSLDSDQTMHGIVKETMEGSGYTFMRVNTDEGDIWVATSNIPIAVGDEITFKSELPMRNFTSSALNRTFDLIYFANDVLVGATFKSMMSRPDMMADYSEGAPVVDQESGTNVMKAADGLSIEELFRDRKSLEDQTVLVRGKVVKFSSQIMNTNWIHIQDGTSHEGKFDLTVTSDQAVKKGDQVLVRGILRLDKDFGYGYVYDVLLENASIQIETLR